MKSSMRRVLNAHAGVVPLKRTCMKISTKNITALGRIVTGDEGLSLYRSGPQLVRLFNDFGSDDCYEQGFPSRWMYAEDKLRTINGTKELQALIKAILDPQDFLNAKMEMQPAIDYLNQRLKYDKYEIVIERDTTKIRDLAGCKVEMVNPFGGSEKECHLFLEEQIQKSEVKLQEGDFDGAITNARALLESVLTEIEKQNNPDHPEYDGDLIKLYRRVQKHLKLDPSRQDIDQTLKQVLSGLVGIVTGLSGLRNKMSDAHVRSYKPARHHAVLVVNASKTLANFLFDTCNYQNKSQP